MTRPPGTRGVLSGLLLAGGLVFGDGLLAGGVALAQEYAPQGEEGLPRIRFADGQISLNDRCPVRLGKLNLMMAPVYVNGKPVGFC